MTRGCSAVQVALVEHALEDVDWRVLAETLLERLQGTDEVGTCAREGTPIQWEMDR